MGSLIESEKEIISPLEKSMQKIGKYLLVESILLIFVLIGLVLSFVEDTGSIFALVIIIVRLAFVLFLACFRSFAINEITTTNNKKITYYFLRTINIYVYILTCLSLIWIILLFIVAIFAFDINWRVGIIVIIGGIMIFFYDAKFSFLYDKSISYVKEDIKKIKISKKIKEDRKKKEIKKDKDIEKMKILISTTGKKFFVKYYYNLKNWEETDIFETIEENLSEKAKISRIKSGRDIFNKGLNILALKEVAYNSENSVDANTINKAKEILNQENFN